MTEQKAASVTVHSDPHYRTHPLFGRSCLCECSECLRDGWCGCFDCCDDRHDHRALGYVDG